MLQGQDWSGYQAKNPSVGGLDFVFVKVTEGLDYVNPHWVAQRDHAKANGLVWGAYHYPHMGNDPVAEADYFLSKVTWKAGDLIALDWEGYDPANRGITDAKKRSYRDAWLKHVKSKMANYRIGMYANTDYWLNVDTTANCGDFLWIATVGKPAGNPGIQHAWTFHQYSTAGGIDHDVANFADKAALVKWAGGTTPPKTPTKSVMPKFPGRQYFVKGAKNSHAKELQTWLAKGNWGPKYKVGPSDTMTQLDLDKVKALQQHYLSKLGPADGLTGPLTWQYAWEVANGLRKK